MREAVIHADQASYDVVSLTIEVDRDPRVMIIASERSQRGEVTNPVGIGQLHPPDMEYPPLLCDLFVEHEHRHRGIGTAIVEVAWGIVDAHEDWEPLHVYYTPDSPGRPLFRELGFEENGDTGVEGQSEEIPEYIWAFLPEPPEDW